MRILYLSRAQFPSEVSHTLSIMRMCQALTDSGHEVILTGRVSSAGVVENPIGYYGLRGGFIVSLRHVGRLLDNRITRRLLLPSFCLAMASRSFFRDFKPDLVYSRLTVTELALVPKGTPIVFEMHSLGPIGSRGLEAWAFRWLMRHKKVVRLAVTTEGLAASLKQAFPHIDVQVARLSAELPVTVAEAVLATFRRNNLKGPHFDSHVGYTGYLDIIGLRGTDVLCQVASVTPEAAFHIVGGEPQIVEHWKRYAKQYNQHGNIFFYGYRKPSEMPLFLGCFDVVVAPLQLKISNRAPTGMNMSPLKLPQYMSYGKAIVASDLLAHREILTSGDTAVLVSHADVEAWRDAICRLLRDPELREAMGARARARYYAEFTPEQRVNRILSGLGVQAGLGE
jgi:glycosyltransferase involved in cell wall biosynthesis